MVILQQSKILLHLVLCKLGIQDYCIPKRKTFPQFLCTFRRKKGISQNDVCNCTRKFRSSPVAELLYLLGKLLCRPKPLPAIIQKIKETGKQPVLRISPFNRITFPFLLESYSKVPVLPGYNEFHQFSSRQFTDFITSAGQVTFSPE